ncbi:MAG: GGDEF domain-containing protein [Pirellulaceae bacterium]
MWWLLFTFLFNFLFGAGAALVLEWRRHRRSRPRRVDVAQEMQQVLAEVNSGDAAQTAEAVAAAAKVEEIPEEWLNTLESASVESKSFVEASVQVLRLEVGKYREALIGIEERVTACRLQPDAAALRVILEELRNVNADWLCKQAEAAGYLSEKRGGLGEFEKVGGRLEDVLLDQRAQIETTCSNISVLDFESDLSAGCGRLNTEIMRLLALAHSLRDRMQDSMMVIMRADRRLDGVDQRMRRDGLTDLQSRVGYEVILHEWWRDDISRQRLVSLALLDLDHFGKLNEKIGTRRCDRLLASAGRLYDELVPKDRGYNRAIRLEGSTFALFCGDAGPRNAMSAAERIRQTFQESTFVVDDGEHQVTLSCAVTEIQKDDNPESLMVRLKKALRGAKRNGRNCTMLDEGEGPKMVEPPQFQVKGHIVRVDAS